MEANPIELANMLDANTTMQQVVSLLLTTVDDDQGILYIVLLIAENMVMKSKYNSLTNLKEFLLQLYIIN